MSWLATQGQLIRECLEAMQKVKYIPDNFNRDYGRAMQKDFTRQGRALKVGVFSE
jgi:hypothetical protein